MYVVRVKPGVRFDRLAPAGVHILSALDLAVGVVGCDLEISCGTEGHPPDDPHTLGEAFDVSVEHLEPPTILRAMGWLRARLGEAFYLQYETPHPVTEGPLAAIAVVNPNATAPHLHVQRRRGTVWPAPPAAPLRA